MFKKKINILQNSVLQGHCTVAVNGQQLFEVPD